MLIQVSETFLEGERARNVSAAIYFKLDPRDPVLLYISLQNPHPLWPGTTWLFRRHPDHERIASTENRREPQWFQILEICRLPGISATFITVCFHRYVEDGQYLFNYELNCQLWKRPLIHVGMILCHQEGKTCICLVCIIS